MLAVGIATLIVRRSDATIYRSQLRTRHDSPAHRLQFGLPLLSNVTVSEVMAPLRVVLHAEDPVARGPGPAARRAAPGRAGGRRGGVVPRGGDAPSALEEAASGDPEIAARTTRRRHRTERDLGAALDVALEALGTTPETWVTVTDSGQHVVGHLHHQRAHRRVPPGAGREHRATVRAGRQRRAGRAPRRLGRRWQPDGPSGTPALPAGTIVVTIERDGALVFADGDTVLEPGDLVSALARPDAVDALPTDSGG